MPAINIPLPETLLQITWCLIGFFAGRAGAKSDDTVKESKWFKDLCPWQQSTVSALLDFTHHFWIGLLLMTYSTGLIIECPEMYWFGTGLFIDDLPDIPARFARWFHYLGEKLDYRQYKKDVSE